MIAGRKEGVISAPASRAQVLAGPVQGCVITVNGLRLGRQHARC
jgi:hypothetical protein